ncbi:hypothetical protein L873DRAFT_766852 [Choiromyces venosus 120613-1]|uniref:Uncharacterized protein n=1 Tax=Choiromyces venosus 120613-1 TaxID=1336337 RepID=A0A3N4IS11_9PEZI|nr:hypothetical protein L873DRAFT_766852 [Choiromyces venosus 120613-1]
MIMRSRSKVLKLLMLISGTGLKILPYRYPTSPPRAIKLFLLRLVNMIAFTIHDSVKAIDKKEARVYKYPLASQVVRNLLILQ